MFSLFSLAALFPAPGCHDSEPPLEDEWVHVPGGASFSGGPSYISEFQEDFRDNGGPLSDMGSHCGVKAEVDDRRFAGLRHYACVTGTNVVDYSRTGLLGTSTLRLADPPHDLAPASTRAIVFEPFGWTETARDRNIEAVGRVSFVATDAYVLTVEVRNLSDGPVRVAPELLFEASTADFRARLDRAGRAAIFSGRVSISLGLGRNYLAIGPGPELDSHDFEADRRGRAFCLTGGPVEIDPRESRSFDIVFAYSPDREEDALALLEEAREILGGSTGTAFDLASSRWEAFFASLPAPHTDEARFTELYRLAATGLEMGLYAPRSSMSGWGAVPTKVHYNFFWLWDSGLQAVGLSELDPAAAEQVIATVMAPQGPQGFLAHMTNEDLVPLTPHSQSPVFGWAAARVAERDPDPVHRRAFIEEMVHRGEQFLAWWEADRDQDGDGLFEFLSQDEGGWDNSPRMNYVDPILFIPYLGSLGEVIASRTKPLDAVDLNSWIYLYYRAMADWCAELGDPSGAAGWRARAGALSEAIDRILWSETRGCWLDAYRPAGAAEHTHWEVLTPAVWFPAFAGASGDIVKIRRVIEEHLLNPDEFFGRYPIPSVAYNDPAFDLTEPGWKGYIWLVTLYPALPVLFRYGYEEEARALALRTLEMMASQGGMKGIWETYDPLTGSYKNAYSTGGYCSFQFGWSSAFAMEILLERYQAERYVFEDTVAIRGHIRRAEVWGTGEVLYEVSSTGAEVPHVEITSPGDGSLLSGDELVVSLEDPYGALGSDEIDCTILGRTYRLGIGTGRHLKGLH